MLNSFQTNRRLSTKDFVYFEIKKKIIEGILEPDQPINEENLASNLNISRTPIREALQRLEIEELIIRLPNGRLKVAPISIQEVEEIFNVRSLLEGLIAREATTKATSVDIQKLGQLTQHIVDAANNERGEEVVNYGIEFHSYLYQISKNITANKILNQLNDHIARYRRLGPTKNNERSRNAAKEHQEMFKAISNKNPDKAEKLMKEHIINSLKAAVHTIELHLRQNNDQKH